MADNPVSLPGNKNVLFTNRQLVTLMWPLLLEQMLAIAVGRDRRRRGDQRRVAGRLHQQPDDLYLFGDGDGRRGGRRPVYRTEAEGGRLQRGPAAHRAAGGGVRFLCGAAVSLPPADPHDDVRPYRSRRHGRDEHLLFICDGFHPGHRALQRRWAGAMCRSRSRC